MARSTVTETSMPCSAASAAARAGRGCPPGCGCRTAASPCRSRGGARRSRRAPGRSGARPMPPAISTTSRPVARSSGHGCPYGPRTPSAAPLRSGAWRCVTVPTSRVVCTIVRPSRIAAHGDRHLADTEDVEHVELSGLERVAAIVRVQLQREGVVAFLHAPAGYGRVAPPADWEGQRASAPQVCWPYTSRSWRRVCCKRSSMICAKRFSSS